MESKMQRSYASQPRFSNQGPTFPNTLRMEWYDCKVYKAGEGIPVGMQFAEEYQMVGTFEVRFLYGFHESAFPLDRSFTSLGLHLWHCGKTVARFADGERVKGAGIDETDFSDC